MDEQNQFDQDDVITTALNEYPLMPLPPGFVNQVMEQVTHLPQWTPPPFKLQFIDVAIPAFTAVFVYIAFLTGWWLSGQANLAWLPELQTDMITNHSQSFWLLSGWVYPGIAILIGECALLLLVGTQLWQQEHLA